jgi:hypothetical protein
VTCPYFQPECPTLEPAAVAGSCPQCRRLLKTCPACGAHTRAFANFCRSCGARLSVSEGDWLSYRGGSQRLGASTPPLPVMPQGTFELQEEDFKLELGDLCRSLLGYDRHLIAVSQRGTIEIRDPGLPAPGLRLKTEGPISCEPCIDDGVLYLGSPGRLTAYSFGILSMANPRLTPLWQLRLSGTPVQALTMVADHLFVTVVRADMRRELLVIDNVKRQPPTAGRVLYVGAKLSWIAADPARRQAVFVSEEGENLQLHRVAHDGARAELSTWPLTRTPRPLADNVPIAFLGGKVFGVFGDEEKLCRIDADSGELEQSLGDDTKMFSLSHEGEREWDGDGVQIFSNGVLFLHAGRTDSFTPLDRVVKGSPVLLKGRAAVLAMLDGRLRVYDLRRLPRYDQFRLTSPGEPITALACFQNYIAVGNVKGVVKLLTLHGKPA